MKKLELKSLRGLAQMRIAKINPHRKDGGKGEILTKFYF